MKKNPRDNHGWTPNRIKALRVGRCDDEWQFAKQFRTHWRVVQRWESGENVPTGPATVILDHLDLKLKQKQVGVEI